MQGTHEHLSAEQKQLAFRLRAKGWRLLDIAEEIGYIDWFNHRRHHGEITDDNTYVTPTEFEAAHYRQTARALGAVTQ